MTTTPGPAWSDALSAILRGEDLTWDGVGVPADEFIARCDAEELIGLVHERLRASSTGKAWPQALRDELAARTRRIAAEELSRQVELRAVLEALAQADVHPIMFKGTPLAYSLYAAPALRPRCDTDLIIERGELDVVRGVMTRIGYAEPICCDSDVLFNQIALTRCDQFGVEHCCDFHWKISSQSTFADLLTHEELGCAAVRVPALGPHARAAGAAHALLLACIHPVMHHANVERLIWVYDTHLLASRLSDDELEHFTNLAVVKGVGPICARQFLIARSRFGTSVPDHVLSRLGATGSQALTEYLRPGRRWYHEFLWNLLGLPSWRDRLRLVRELVFPSPRHMLSAYHFSNRFQGVALLPLLYLRRGVRGLWNTAAGRR